MWTRFRILTSAALSALVRWTLNWCFRHHHDKNCYPESEIKTNTNAHHSHHAIDSEEWKLKNSKQNVILIIHETSTSQHCRNKINSGPKIRFIDLNGQFWSFCSGRAEIWDPQPIMSSSSSTCLQSSTVQTHISFIQFKIESKYLNLVLIDSKYLVSQQAWSKCVK